MFILPLTSVVKASEAMGASKQPRRSKINSVTLNTYVPMSFRPLTVTVHLIFPGGQTPSIDFVSSTEVIMAEWAAQLAPKHASLSKLQREGKKEGIYRCFHAFRILALELITGTEIERDGNNCAFVKAAKSPFLCSIPCSHPSSYLFCQQSPCGSVF